MPSPCFQDPLDLLVAGLRTIRAVASAPIIPAVAPAAVSSPSATAPASRPVPSVSAPATAAVPPVPAATAAPTSASIPSSPSSTSPSTTLVRAIVPCILDAQLPPIVLASVQSVDGVFGVMLVEISDKPEAPALLSSIVLRDVDIANPSVAVVARHFALFLAGSILL